jgi:hypothetical protein
MKLTEAQIAEFDERGYLYLPGQFTAEEIAPLRDEAERLFAMQRQEVWRETSGAARTGRIPAPDVPPLEPTAICPPLHSSFRPRGGKLTMRPLRQKQPPGPPSAPTASVA